MRMILSIALLLLPAVSPALTPYAPEQPNPVLEPWRWRSLSSTREMFLRSMMETGDGHLWFGGPDGVIRYNGLLWIIYGREDGLDGTPVVALTSSDGVPHCATTLGIYRLNDTSWERIFPDNGDQALLINDIASGGDGTIWASSAFGLFRLAASGTTLYTTEELAGHFEYVWPDVRYVPVPRHLAPATEARYGSLGIQRSGDNVVWVIADSPADSAGIRVGDRILDDRRDGATIDLTVERQRVGRIELRVTARSGSGPIRVFDLGEICVTERGGLWSPLVTGAGVVRLDPTTGSWTLHDRPDALRAGGRIRFLDDGDDLWAVSDDPTHGLARFDGVSWSEERLSDVGGVDRNPSIARTPDGTVWIGGHEGILHAFRGDRWEVYRAPDIPIPKTRILDLVASTDGALWFLGNGRMPLRLEYGTSRWSTYEGLNYQTQDASGRQWFLTHDGTVVSRLEDVWSRHDAIDSLVARPTGVTADPDGGVWVTGSHLGTAAVAGSTGNGWRGYTLPELSWGVDPRSVMVGSDGTLWLGAAGDWDPDRGHRGGVARREAGRWIHDRPPDVLSYVHGIAEVNGEVWIGSDRGLHRFSDGTWTRIREPREQTSGIDVLHATSTGDLLVGHRTRGIYRYDGTSWRRSGVEEGLADNTLRAVLETRDGSIWAMTDQAISRSDGRTWTTPALPATLPTSSRGTIRQSGDGAIWINTAFESWHRRARSGTFDRRTDRQRFRTVRYVPDRNPPDTRISFAEPEVSQPGNTTISWHGADRWHETSAHDLQYAWRLDGSEWSEYSGRTAHTFQLLPPGPHRFEVRARDRAFNVDPEPAVAKFSVLPPVWRQTWFILLVSAFTIAVVIQTRRVILRDRDLTRSNEALQNANTDLETLNRSLTETNRRLEETRDQLVQSEKMASLGHLVAGVAHEVNNPIGAFGSAADTLKRCIERIASRIESAATVDDIRNDPQVQRAIAVMASTTDNAVRAGQRVTGIVASLRHFAHLDESEYQKVDLRKALDSIVTLRTHELSDRITVTRVYKDIPEVACYASELNQALMNLFVNAMDAIDGPGTIELETRTEAGCVVIAITDTGRGIAPENLSRIFDPGYTTKGVGVGVGLGLSTAYRIVQKHNGRIDVTSEPGRGSTFTVSIPLIP